MHIPDGFLNLTTAVTTTVVATSAIGFALRQTKSQFPAEKLPMIGLTAAFVFAAQMLNFPVGGGTSGHLLGSTLVAILLGPVPAMLVMTSVLLLQCLLFADGGITALGANLLNMAVIAPLFGYGSYRLIHRIIGHSSIHNFIAIGIAAWLSTVASAVACALELASSGIVPLTIVLPAMAGIHAIIGLGEATITILVLRALTTSHSEFVLVPHQITTSRQKRIGLALLSMTVIGLLLTPLASALPDGLEKVADRLGFNNHAITFQSFQSPFAEYSLPSFGEGALSTMLAGVVGVIAIFGIGFLITKLWLISGTKKSAN